MTDKTTTYEEQSIPVPLSGSARVVLYEEVDIDADEGMASTVMFSDYVERYVPETGLLEFEQSDTGRAEFIELVKEADGIEILNDYDRSS